MIRSDLRLQREARDHERYSRARRAIAVGLDQPTVQRLFELSETYYVRLREQVSQRPGHTYARENSG
jgi:hypothetical protein